MFDDSLIYDSIVATIPIDAGRGSTVAGASLNSAHARVERLLRRICDSRRQQLFVIFGSAVDVLFAGPGNPSTGTTFIPRDNNGFEARIVFAPTRQPAQRINLRVNLAGGRANVSTSWLTVEVNPTTLIAGNNVVPTTIANSVTGEIPTDFSSHWSTIQTIYRLGFDLLEELNRQALATEEPLFSTQTRNLIRSGDIRLARSQWASYLPTFDVRRFLQTVALLYGHTFAHGTGVMNLAAHCGLAFDMYTNADSDVTGVMLRKKHGKKQLFSVVFYDKRARVAQMRQGKTLMPIEQSTIDRNIRVDVTAHAQGIMTLVRLARRKLTRLRKKGIGDSRPSWGDAFLADEPKPTVWWLERAIFVLSHSLGERGVTRRSFGRWLMPYVVREILRLDVIAGFRRLEFFLMRDDEDAVARAWRSVEEGASGNWAKRLARAAKVSLATVYQRRNQLMAQFGIDVELPYAFFRDLMMFGSIAVMKPGARSALIGAVQSGDGKAAVRLLEPAAEEFDRARREIVSPTISSRPQVLRVRVAAAPLSAPKNLTVKGAVISVLPDAKTRAASGLERTDYSSERTRSSVSRGIEVGRVDIPSHRR